jgi:hypothetical protein
MKVDKGVGSVANDIGSTSVIETRFLNITSRMVIIIGVIISQQQQHLFLLIWMKFFLSNAYSYGEHIILIIIILFFKFISHKKK